MFDEFSDYLFVYHTPSSRMKILIQNSENEIVKDHIITVSRIVGLLYCGIILYVYCHREKNNLI